MPRTRLLVTAASVLALLGAACGATAPGSRAPATEVHSALATTSETPSFHLTWINTLGPKPLAQYVYLTGVVNLAGDRLQMTSVGITGPAAEGLAPGSTPPEPLPPGQSATSMFICIGSDLWINGAPNSWLRQAIPASKQLAGLPVGDPKSIFSGLEKHVTAVTSLGHTRIGGVETSRFRGVERGKLLGGVTHVTVGLWIDAHDLIRQLTATSSISYPASTSPTSGRAPALETTATITARFSDFGVHTDIRPPPASEVNRGVTPP
jgi:hypothetical protein